MANLPEPMTQDISRRGLIATAGALALVGSAQAQEPVFDDTQPTRGIAVPSAEHKAEMEAAPTIRKTVNKLYNTRPAYREPNALQFTPAGTLLVLDQQDQPTNKIFEIDPSDGRVIRSVQSDICVHGSGICIDDDGKWIITSTKGPGDGPPLTLRVEPTTGKTIARWVTPGWGFYGADRAPRPGTPPITPSGGHDVKWAGNGRYWIAIPASGRIMLMDARTGKSVRSFLAPVNRTHGLALDGDYLWSVASDYAQIHKIDTRTGKLVAKIQLDKANDPVVHGLEIRNGVLWYCDAGSGWMCTLT